MKMAFLEILARRRRGGSEADLAAYSDPGTCAALATPSLGSIAALDAAPLAARQSVVRYLRVLGCSRGSLFESVDGMWRYWISPDGKDVSRFVPFFLPSSHLRAGWESVRGLIGADAAAMIDEIMRSINDT